MEDANITLSRWLWRRTSRSLALLMLVLAVVVFQLVGFVRGLDTELLLTVAMLGLLIGWGCARSRLSGRLAFIAMCALGLVSVFVRVGRLDGQVLNLLRVLADFA